MDETGYPFKLSRKELPIGSKVMPVADVSTALTEDRPYRKGVPPEQAETMLRKMADPQALDPDVVSEALRDLESTELESPLSPSRRRSTTRSR